jgi:hypothetical protein
MWNSCFTGIRPSLYLYESDLYLSNHQISIYLYFLSSTQTLSPSCCPARLLTRFANVFGGLVNSRAPQAHHQAFSVQLHEEIRKMLEGRLKAHDAIDLEYALACFKVHSGEMSRRSKTLASSLFLLHLHMR